MMEMKEKKFVDEIIKKIPNCSVITNKDQPLFEKFLKFQAKKFPYHYSRNWIFIKQISQISKGYGIKYFDKNKEHLITIAPDWGGEIPNYIYLPLGKDAIKSVPMLARELSQILKNKIIVKKIYGEKNRNYLLKNGFVKPPLHDYEDFSKRDDDKYPEIICDVNNIIRATQGLPTTVKMSHFKRNIKKIFSHEYNFDEKDLSKNIEKDFRDLIDNWSTNMAKRTAKRYKKGANIRKIKKWVGKVYYPHFIEEYADKVDNKKIISYVTFIDKEAVAFTSAYPISNNCLAVNASLCDTSYEGLGEYLFFRLASRVKKLGYKYLNLGSNDNKEQHQYKSFMGIVYKVYPYIFEYECE